MSERHSSNGISRAAVYLRMSDDKQENSIGRQRSQVLPYVTRRGYQLLREYVDEGIAGDEFEDRPAFQQLLRDAKAGKLDVIVVDEPSRLSRQDPIEYNALVAYPLRSAGVRVDTVSKGPLDWESLAGHIMNTIHAAQAAEESRNLARRVMAGLVKKAKGGGWGGGIVPYALRVERVERDGVEFTRLVPGDPEEVKVLLLIFEAVGNRGWTAGRVARELNARGVSPPKGNGWRKGAPKGQKADKKLWSRWTIYSIVHNRKYVGDLRWNQTHRGKYAEHAAGEVRVSAVKNDRVHRHAEADVIVAPGGSVEPLIGRDLFTRANAALAANRKQTCPKGGGERHLFTRMLVCADCGAFMVGGTDARGQRKYVCGSYSAYGRKRCFSNAVLEAPLRDRLLEAVQREALNPDKLADLEARMLAKLEAQRRSGEEDRLRRKVAGLDRDIEQGNHNLTVLPADRLAGVVARVRALEAERSEALARLEGLENGAEEIRQLVEEGKRQLWRLREGLQAEDADLVRAVLREVVVKVEMHFGHHKAALRTYSKWRRAVIHARPGLGIWDLMIPVHRRHGFFI
jgi:site-specific DNA recombinase